jgi:hypothetical protein
MNPDSSPIRSFHISPIIRITLLSLYGALTIPLPFLAKVTDAPVLPIWLWIGIMIGAIALYGGLSERVILTTEAIQVAYPRWFPTVLRRGWLVQWSEIQALKPKTTGQGGLVYYILTSNGDAFLLPMRIAGFAQLVREMQAKTGIDTTDVKPLAQPWMYFILFGFTVLLWLVDAWTITTAIGMGVAI